MFLFQSTKSLKSKLALVLFAIIAIALVSQARAAVIGNSLLDVLDQAGIDQPLQVIVSFEGDGPLNAQQLGLLETLGLSGIYFQALPIAGVVATPEQVLQLADTEGVRSVWLNEQLAYDNADARALTGVDRMRTDPNLRNAMGLPYSGKGIGVMINDSGIDATHPDLTLGEQTVQNVLGTTNLNAVSGMLPVTWIENVPDTDIGSGHGTHVAGTVGGTGAASGGLHAGVAPGASLLGYGSGAVLLILDTIGAFDYALVNQFRYNIRVINNSWGTPGDTGTDFNPDDPISIATKRLADRNVMIVFSAGNSGPGEDTIGGNYMKAPWIIRVGASNKDATLTDFSSRGKRGGGGTVEVDGQTYQWFDRPTVTAPGADIISALATTGVLGLTAVEGPFYARMSGTSMSGPHVAGIVALMLEANPLLHWSEVIDILETTATNMPGREAWEVGAGMVNAYAAVTMAAGLRDDYGQTLNLGSDFNATVNQSRVEGDEDFELFFSPVGSGPAETFFVEEGLSSVIASANVTDNTVAIVLTDPNGNRYGSGISLPLLGSSIAVTAPAMPGEWTIEARGIGAVSGVALDPLGLTNGIALPGSVTASVDFMRVDGFTALNDIQGHPAQGIIETAVARRLVDSRNQRRFRPNSRITRAEMADYLTMGGGIRQFRPTDGSDSFNLNGTRLANAEANGADGGALRDLHQVQEPVMLMSSSGNFEPNLSVARAELAYSLVQALGLQAQADETEAALASQPITVAYEDRRIALEDDAEVPTGLRGHVQLALDLQLIPARFSLEQGPFDLFPTVQARFDPASSVDRAGYAWAKVNFFDRYRQGN